MLLAKPTLEISIQEHTNHVVNEAKSILGAHPFVRGKYSKLTGKDLEKRVVTAAKYHDIGKQHPIWQEACRKDYEIFKQTGQESNMRYLRKANFRHEIASLLIDPRLEALSDVVKAAIGAHHRKLCEDVAHRWEDSRQGGAELWRLFKGIKNKVTNSSVPFTQKFEDALKRRYEFSGPRCYLQLADHRASAQEDGQELPPLQSFKYDFPHKIKRGVQHIIPELQDELFAILRAPTGSGKTDAALLWAQHQIDSGQADRLVIAMPTRFTANALSISTAKNLSQTGLYHSSAWFQRIQSDDFSTDKKGLIKKEQQLARLLETPITVTTIDHLCISLTGTREDHHAIFFNLAHSCVVIDEADFYDEFTQYNILVLLRVLRLLRVPVLLMSATVPNSSREFFNLSGLSTSQIHEDSTNNDRVRYEIVNDKRAVAVPDDCNDLLELSRDTPLIIYANTVSRAQSFYRWFMNQEEFSQNGNVTLYHSRFTEPHKANIENTLTENLGAKAWQSGKPKGIAILTQIGELSVNISAEVMISDICPLDRLAQRAGRLSRFGESIGKLYIIEPFKVSTDGDLFFYPAPYGTFKDRKWQTSEVLEQSRTLLPSGQYSSSDLVDLVDELYPKPNLSPDSLILSNTKELERLVISNWLILPADRLDEDDDETTTWKSRDIEPQYTVYVNFDFIEGDFYFKNFSALREFQLLHGIQCYASEFHQAREKGYLEQATFIVGEQGKVSLWLVRVSFYDSKIGLHFDEDYMNDF